MVALDEIEKLTKLFHEHKLKFSKRIFEEYSTLLTKIHIDSSKNDLILNKKSHNQMKLGQP